MISQYYLWMSLKRKALTLVGVGALLLALTNQYTWSRWQAEQLANQARAAESVVVAPALAPPRHLYIAGKVDVPVQTEVYDNGVWSLSAETASYLQQSALPGQAGNIIVYGHNKPEILGPLQTVTGSETVVLTTADGKQRQYRITEVRQVNLDQVEYLQPTDAEVLTIYTCAGWLDSKRLVVRAEPIETVAALP